MPISMQQIAANTATATFRYNEEDVTIVYLPSLVTEKTFAQLTTIDSLKDTSQIAESFASLNDVLSRLIKSWDVYDDEAMTVMFPLDPTRLAELPIAFRMKALQAIMGSLNPEAMAV